MGKELEYKIEVNDDFNDKYGEEEDVNNDDQLEDLSDDSVTELQGSYFIYETNGNTFYQFFI